ncbi:hypothetical protein [Gracilibacillus suaedae]|uniref:hypothetical protein n=1 Tax=Gracilibacillus suaedae TaxID=2820273 RepID=UPI001ABE13D0|nr:hypothetical protein [Gracilibacillus suaedae]
MEEGTTGIDWSGLSLPFDVGDLITSGNGLLGMIGGFVLVALAFIFVPKVITLIRQSFSAARGK